MSSLVKKYQIGLFIADENDKWVHVKKSTDLTLALNPETQEFDYIADQRPTTEVLRYAPSLSQPVAMWKGEEDFDLFFDLVYNLRDGDDAKRDVLIVFMTEGNSDDGFKAWKTNATLVPSELNGVDSNITVDINFGGTIEQGTVAPDEQTHEPVFTKTGTIGTGDWEYPFDD